MAVPSITQISPATGPTSGGDVVRLVGAGFAERVEVRFGERLAETLSVREEAGLSVADVRTPSHDVAVVDVTLTNLDEDSIPIPGEVVTVAGAYRFIRPRVARESDLTRLVRTLLRELKRQVVANVSATVSVDYDDTVADGLRIVAMASLPSLVLSGPTIRTNRFYSSNVPHEDVVNGTSGPEIVRRRPPYTVDLVFTITAASDRTAELFNLMSAVATFTNRNRWIEMLRDPDDPGRGSVRWEMDVEGEFQTQLAGRDDVRGFTCTLVVRGFDVDEGLPMDVGKAVIEPIVEMTSVPAP